MKDINDEKKIAVLIDADNAQYSRIKIVLREVSTHGHIITKRAYGDWTNTNLKSWKTQLNELAIQPVQQFAYTTGKNSTDSSLIIEAMDLLYTQKYDAFVLVSSDSDFTRLASRLRESEMYVIGVGETKTPISFRNACDEFLIIENLLKEEVEESEELTERQEKISQTTPRAQEMNVKKNIKATRSETSKLSTTTLDKSEMDVQELIPILRKAYDKYVDEDGWVNVAPAGSFVKRLKPDFDPRSYGFRKLPDLINSLAAYFEMKKFPGKGKVNIVAFRPLGIDKEF